MRAARRADVAGAVRRIGSRHVVRVGIVADRPRHGAVFGIGIGDVADGIVIGGSGVVRFARVICIARPAQDGHVVPADAVGCGSDGVFGVERVFKRFILKVVERIIAHRAADVDDGGGVTLRAVCIHIIDGAVFVDGRGVRIAQRLGEEVAVVRQAEGREVFRERVQACLFARFVIEARALAAAFGVSDGVTDGAVGKGLAADERIRARCRAPDAVRVVLAPVYIVGQVEDSVVERERLDVFRGYVDDVVGGAGCDLALHLREVQVRVCLVRDTDGDGVFADLVSMLFRILLCPLVDKLCIRLLVCRARKDKDREVICRDRGGIREYEQADHDDNESEYDDLVDNFLHYVPPYKFHPRHGGGRKGRFAAFSWENAAEGPLPCSSDLPNGLVARRQTLRRKKKTPAQNKHLQPFPDERQNHCPFNASAHPPFARRLLYSYHNTQFSPCQYLNSNFL